jgi:hypothetical protein
VRPKLTYANVVATLALFVALGGTSFAAFQLGKNSVKSKNIAKEAVRTSDLAKDAVVSAKVKDGSLLSKDFKAGQLPAGPIGPKGDPGQRGPQGLPGMSGLERVSGGTPDNSESPKLAGATCGPGKVAISAGYDISGGKEGASPNGLANVIADVVETTSPEVVPGAAIVEAWEEDATALTWNLSVFVLCAKVSP